MDEKGVTRLYDYCTGHDLCIPVQEATGSGDVFVNDLPCGRLGDQYATHGCLVLHLPHNDVIAGGSGTVFANDLPVGRIGDPVSIGGSVMTCSVDVFAGD